MDWPTFLETNHIDFVTSGPNTRKGQISVRCPWCGDDDPSEHLSISLTKDAFGCWRNAKHAGRKPYSLVAALLNCSFSQARLIVKQYSTADPATLDDALIALGAETEAPQQAQALPAGLPPDFRQIKPTGLTGRFWRYLAGRGFDDVAALIKRYDLLCCQHGRWKDRIIIPLYLKSELIAWTARAIQPTIHAPRYLSSSSAIKTMIFNEDNLHEGGKTLFITEGPFDAMKVDYYGYDRGQRSTCLFGVNPTLSQIAALKTVIHKFDTVKILFDTAAVEAAFQLSDWLLAPNVIIASLPLRVKDPGALNAKQVLQL